MDILNKLVKIIFFISSYTPLLIILAIKNLNLSYILSTDNIMPLMLVIISIFALFVTKIFLKLQEFIQPEQFEILQIKDKTEDLSAYILTYLVPFFTININDIRDIASLLLFLLIIGLIYINSNMIYINPVLICFGYKILELKIRKDTKEKEIIIIVPNKQFLKKSSYIRCSLINNYYKDIYFYKSKVN